MALEMYVHPVPDTSLQDQPPRKKRWGRRVLSVVLVAGLLLGLVGVLANVVLVGRLERIDGAFAGLGDRPAGAPGSTFLMVGTRPGAVGADVPWLEGDQSVEAIMLIVVAPDGLSARVETLPARSGVSLVATGEAPSATVAAVEQWTGRRVDHLIAIDWTTFSTLAERSGVDSAYAYGSPPDAQHEFLQVVMRGTLHAELRKQPIELYQVLSTTAAGTAVDDEWSTLDLDLTVFSLRDLRSGDISYGVAQPG